MKTELLDNHKACAVIFTGYGEEGEAFQEAFNLCILFHGNRGPGNAKWFVRGILMPHECSDALGEAGIIGWKLE